MPPPARSSPMQDATKRDSKPEPRPDLRSFVRRYQDGDESAANDLITALYPVVIKIVRAYLPKRSSEEDMAQMVFLRVFTRLGQYSGQVPLEHWVTRVAVNTCLNEIGKEKVRPELRWADLSEEQEQVLETLARTDDDLHPAQSLVSRELVEQLLGGLNPQDRLVLTLLHLEGRTLDEIHAATGWNRTLIKVRAFRARQKVRKQLESVMHELL